MADNRTPKGNEEHTVYLVIKAHVSSPEYDSVDSIMDEISEEVNYSIPDTSCVRIEKTELLYVTDEKPI